MNRTIHNLEQGSPAWHVHRLAHDNASEAAAMLGLSPHVSRSDLVRLKATGDERETSLIEAKLFADGHTFEAAARPWAEEIIGEELFPCTASIVIDGLRLSASFDGATMAEDPTWEHKTLNQELEAALTRGEIPDHHKPQLEQQLMVLGAARCLFMASKGDRATMKHAWYESDPALRARILAGWKQFREDVKNYVHVEAVTKPAASAATITTLPALVANVDATGIKIRDNLGAFGEALHGYIANVNREPKTDQDFADADEAVKTMERAETALKSAREAVIAQTGDVDTLLRKAADLQEIARQTRLSLSKLIETKKQEIREEIRQEGVRAVAAHVEGLNKRLGRNFMPVIAADFAGAMRGKKTVASLRDAVATEVARVKIAANETADRIQANLAVLSEEAAGYEALFADASTLVLKEPEHFALLVTSRVADHRRKEQDRIDALATKKAEAMVQSPGPLIASIDARDVKVDAGPVYRPADLRVAGFVGARPTDRQIVLAISVHFEVSEDVAAAWLRAMNLEALAA